MDTTPVSVSLYYYNATELEVKSPFDLKSFPECDKTNHVSWVNIVGLHDTSLMQEAASVFNIHTLALEDILHTEQRAKMEDYGDQLFVVLRMFAVVNDNIEEQQVSFLLNDNVVVSFREKDFGIFKSVTDKLQNANSVIRKRGEDFLLYSLIDVVIDHYYIALQHINSKIEKIDKEILANPHESQVYHLQRIKDDVLYMRKCMLPVRDLINNLVRNDIDYFEHQNKYFLRDLHDHVTRNVEELEFQREQINSLMDLYYSLQTHKMNNVMKTLTIVSFVFLPLTFIASLWGMNFSSIPLADNAKGFWELLAGMAVIAIVLVVYAFSRKWLSRKDFSRNYK